MPGMVDVCVGRAGPVCRAGAGGGFDEDEVIDLSQTMKDDY